MAASEQIYIKTSEPKNTENNLPVEAPISEADETPLEE